MTTVTIDTHGCKLNQADSLVLAKHFLEAVYDIIPSNQVADIYILNSCTVTHVADSKARNAIRVARKMNPNSIIVATGCYAERIGKNMRACRGGSSCGKYRETCISEYGNKPVKESTQ